MGLGMWSVSIGPSDTPQIYPKYTHGYTLDIPRITPSTPQTRTGLWLAKLRGLGWCVQAACWVYPGVHMGCVWGVSELYSLHQGCSPSILAPNFNNFISKHCF